MPFTLPSESARCVAEQWTSLWRSWGKLGTTALILWVVGGQRPEGGCGQARYPQSVEIRYPRIHRGLTWHDTFSTGLAVDTV